MERRFLVALFAIFVLFFGSLFAFFTSSSGAFQSLQWNLGTDSKKTGKTANPDGVRLNAPATTPPITTPPATTPPVTTPENQTNAPVPTAETTPPPTVTTTTTPPIPTTTTPPHTTAPGFALPGFGDSVSTYDNAWAFYLINEANPLPAGYNPNLRYVYKQYRADSRCADYAIQMLEDAKKAGINLMVISGYRTELLQQQNFDALMQEFIDKGHTKEQAYNLTKQEIALPGTSEHNAGLALDILSEDWYMHHTSLTNDFDKTAEFNWLVGNSWKYGFILRYPDDKTPVTGIIYEPWHFRFIGVKRAKEVYESGLCLEEFMIQT
ncbi:MAG: M15 family metallopeptidase [Oscillospiraceae bacterium]|nr:M15 family metallopeptidase [Oscillospiraceae bacterium]